MRRFLPKCASPFFKVLFAVALFFSLETTFAQVSTFTSNGSATAWNNPASWSEVGSDVDNIPDADDIVIIGHPINMTAASAANSVTINSGGNLTATGGSLSATTMVVNANGTYTHAINGGTIPTATWAGTSNCIVTGYTGTTPGGVTQNFGNLTWNCTGQTGTFFPVINIQGDFNLLSTGSAIEGRPTDGSTHSIGGNYNHSGGIVRWTRNAAGTLTVGGNIVISGGECRLTNGTQALTLNAGGDFEVSGAGVLTETGGVLIGGSIIFNSGGIQTFTSGGTISNGIDFTINAGTTLQMAAASTVISSIGTFTLSSGASLGIRSTAGISTAGATGNIQTTTRSFSNGANYLYNGSAAQVTGSGLPATLNSLTIDNTAGVTLTNSSTVNGVLDMMSGNLNIGSNLLGLASAASINITSPSASKMIIASGGGTVRKSAVDNASASFTFPIGDNIGATEYSPITLTFSGGSYTAAYVEVSVANIKHPNNPNGTDYLNRYWTVNTSGITTPSYKVDATYVDADAVGAESNISMNRYTGAGTTWVQYDAANTGTNLLSTGATSVTATGSVNFSGLTTVGAVPNVLATPAAQSICCGVIYGYCFEQS